LGSLLTEHHAQAARENEAPQPNARKHDSTSTPPPSPPPWGRGWIAKISRTVYDADSLPTTDHGQSASRECRRARILTNAATPRMVPLRVAHFIQRYPPALGGSEAYFARLSRHLVAAGDEVTVFTSAALDLEAFWSPRGRCVEPGCCTEDGVRV